MKPETFRRMVKWLGIVILAHLAAMLIFAIVLAGSAESFAKESPAYAYSIVLTFDIIFYVAFVFLVNPIKFGLRIKGRKNLKPYKKILKEMLF